MAISSQASQFHRNVTMFSRFKKDALPEDFAPPLVGNNVLTHPSSPQAAPAPVLRNFSYPTKLQSPSSPPPIRPPTPLPKNEVSYWNQLSAVYSLSSGIQSPEDFPDRDSRASTHGGFFYWTCSEVAPRSNVAGAETSLPPSKNGFKPSTTE